MVTKQPPNHTRSGTFAGAVAQRYNGLLEATVTALLVGIPLGVLSSLIAWWILFHAIVPKVRYSNRIAKGDFIYSPSGTRCRIRLENFGRRDILDVELFARLRVRGLRPEAPTTWDIVYPRIGYAKIPKLPRSGQPGSRLTLTIHPHELDDFSIKLLPDNLQTKVGTKELTLDELMSLGTQSELHVYAFGYDAFSGTRRVFESPPYLLSDIQLGVFGPGSLDLVESTKQADSTDNHDYTEQDDRH